jgi:diguanylate cyclase (GGDEF)-like protein
MRSDRPKRRSGAAVRIVTAGICVLILVLAGVAITGGIEADRSTARLARSGDLVQAYLDLTRAVAVQHAAGEDRKRRTRPRTRQRFDKAGVVVARSLDVLGRFGDPADRELRARIEVYERLFTLEFERYFDALDANDIALARTFKADGDPWAEVLQGLVSEGGTAQASESLREINALRDSQANALRFTAVAVLLGLGVMVALWLVLRSLRLRIDDATEEDLQRLQHAALTDSLTGIRNHRAFEEDLATALANLRRHGTTMSLVMIDLDELKAINDSDGHQAGDRAIRTVGDRLSDTLRAGDSVYRIGGDEFAALLPEASTWAAFNLAQRLHASLESDGGGVTVSVGLAESNMLSTRDGLIEKADIALLEAKAGGRDTVVFLSGMERPDLTDSSEDRRHRGTLASALARAVDAKDSYTRSHSETVAELCALIATNLGLDGEHVAAVRLAGLVHDVGKIGVPDAILQKPARLDEHEFEIIKAHSALGHRILHGTDLSHEAPWVLHHHERMDGAGYPGSLVGDEIPLESRIIHVADAFEAMTSDRPYRRGMPDGDALDELRRHVDTQFDPACVGALLSGLGVEPAVAAAT